MIRVKLAIPLAAFALAAVALPALAAEPITLTLKDHKFTPADIAVPVGERFRIQLTNQDETPAELESYDLKFEKIAPAGVPITVIAGPLKPGTYKFFDDYHPDLATGTVTAKE